MKKTRIKAILFDKDGTLIEFERTWFPIVSRVLDGMRRDFGLPREIVTLVARASGIGPRGFLRESLVQSATTSDLVAYWAGFLQDRGFPVPEKSLAELFREASTRQDLGPYLVAGVQSFLARLLAKGFRLGIATSDSRASTIHGLSQAGILDSFDFIAADGDGLPAKPDPGAALEFRRRFDLPEDGLAIIGDSYGDMVFARRSGSRFIGMRTGCNESGRFVEAGYPVVTDFSDLAAMEALLA